MHGVGTGGRIVLLMKEPEAAFFRDILHRANSHLDIRHTPSLEALKAATTNIVAPTRLIAFSTQLIVPKAVLDAVHGNAYNFHPGPPEYPGSKPSAFAVYDGARSFGVTLHRMEERVDSGPIVATRRFPIAIEAEARTIALEAYTTMARLAVELAGDLASVDRPLRTNGEHWNGPKRTLADYEALRRVANDLPWEELERRLRACDGLYSPLPPG